MSDDASTEPPRADAGEPPAGLVAEPREPRAGAMHPARLVIAVLCLLAGAAASLIGARAVTHSDARGRERAFTRSSSTLSATAAASLAQTEDALTSAATYLTHNPTRTPAEFETWVRWARALHDRHALESVGLVALVRTRELAAFDVRVSARPAKTSRHARAGATSTYQCLSAASVARAGATAVPADADYCQSDPALLRTRDTAQAAFVEVATPRGAGLEELLPVYRNDVTPKTSAGRRAAFLGWARALLVPGVVLERALSKSGLRGARLRHSGSVDGEAFVAGSAPSGAPSQASELSGGWALRTFGAPTSTSILSDGDALVLLILGIVATLEAAALVLVLARRRPTVLSRTAVERPAAPREELYDPLTSVPNRGLTLDRAERMLARAGRNSGTMVGALFVDIDWFKDVNDKLGQDAGDQLLRIVAERLQGVVRAHDTVGRYGGDEFVVLVESAVRGMRLDSLARRIIEALHKPVELEGFGPSFCLTASIGVAFGRYATPDDLLRDAHMALVAAKAAGKDRYTLFNANMRSVIEGRGVLEVDLGAALQEGQFSLRYQPVYELATRRVVGLEALLRWQHPVKGELAPSEFVELAEESGLIVPIGRWVLEEACARTAAWNVAGHRVGIAVKVSPRQLARDGFATDVTRALQQSGLEPSMLALEIAETTVTLDKAAAARRLAELKALGVKIAVDDFGGGYAYRSDLQRMPIDFLKVDRSSLAASEDEDYRSWLLEAILVFGRDLSLTVIAKGVESQEQLGALQAMGCTLAQGFFLGEPLPAESVPGLFGVTDVPAPAAPAAEIPAAGTSLGEPPLTDAQ